MPRGNPGKARPSQGLQQKRNDIVDAYLQEHPDAGCRTIARYLFNRYPGLWNTENAVYMRVRKMRGVAGKQNRKNTAVERRFPKIPAADKKRKPLVRLRDQGRWLLCSDLHVPYHDPKAVDAMFRYAIDKKADHLLLNGDLLDAYQQSMWVKDPNKRNTDSEIKILGQMLKEVEKFFPGRKIYKIGNHEERIQNYLYMNAPKMVGITKWDLGEVLKQELGLGDGWTFIASKQLYTLGKLNGYHGHELPRGLTNPVSVGRGVWLRTKQNGFTSHWHSTSTHVESNGAKTHTWVCFSLGCLCDLQPDYGPINGWNHGFALCDIEKNGNFNETNLRIVDGEVW